MIKIIPILIIASAVLTSCGGGKQQTQASSTIAKGPVNYGGVFRVNEVEDFRSLFPLNVTGAPGFRVASQIYEGLINFNQKDLTIQPALAESWEINDSATSFTFHIRKGVKFHDDPCFPEGKGREVTAHDFKYAFTNICSLSAENQMFVLLDNRVVGAAEYFESTVNETPLAEGVTGIKVIDDYTLQIDLENPFPGFLKILCHNGCWVYPQEAYDKYGIEMRIKCVGTGAFTMKKVKEGEAVILQKNINYWKYDEHGNQLPYLDAIKISFLKEKKSELLEFRKGNLDMVFKLPLEMIDDVLGELDEAKRGGNSPFQMQVSPAFSVQFYGFQHQSELFSNKDLRLAFNHAIDREALVKYTLQGDGTTANYGIVPPGFKGYDYAGIRGHKFDPKKAKDLLAKAGYPKGKGFPELTLQINSGGSINEQVAEAIQSMIKEHLNIALKLEILPFAQHLENVEAGKALFYRTAWIADYPDPENFLSLLYGKHVPDNINEKSSYLNSMRYKSAEFDALLDKARTTIDEKERFELYKQADQVALDDAALLPIYYDEYTRLLQMNVKNFPQNAMEYRDFTAVYFEKEAAN
jgi:oligopeptide transport system substrate-binding protein